MVTTHLRWCYSTKTHWGAHVITSDVHFVRRSSYNTARWTVRLYHSHNHTKHIQSTAQQMCSSRYVTKLAKWYWSNGDGCHYI
jgi:hypothetical protein